MAFNKPSYPTSGSITAQAASKGSKDKMWKILGTTIGVLLIGFMALSMIPATKEAMFGRAITLSPTSTLTPTVKCAVLTTMIGKTAADDDNRRIACENSGCSFIGGVDNTATGDKCVIPEKLCTDGLDNDGDFLKDCADPDCVTGCPNAVTLYIYPNYGGFGQTYTANAATMSIVLDNKGNSLRVRGSTAVVLYDQASFSGSSVRLFANVPRLAGFSFNNLASSLKVVPATETICTGGKDEDYDAAADCADADCASLPACCTNLALFYKDADADSYGSSEVKQECVAGLSPTYVPAGYAVKTGDCLDTNANVNPGLTYDDCDGLDNNCDGSVDAFGTAATPNCCSGVPTDLQTSISNCGACGIVCSKGQVCSAGKCGTAPTPMAEVCYDKIDNDFDGKLDCLDGDDCGSYCNDLDADGYSMDKDCLPNDPAVHLYATEICDAKDNDCNGQVDELLQNCCNGNGNLDLQTDNNNCGACGYVCPISYYCAAGACYRDLPKTETVCNDGLDEDYDSTKDCADSDCVGQIGPAGGKCCLIAGHCASGQTCTANECVTIVVQAVDVDADGYTAAQGDCNDYDPVVNPGATEICDGLDNNCNSQINENQAANCCNGALINLMTDNNNCGVCETRCLSNNCVNGVCGGQEELPVVDGDTDGVVDSSEPLSCRDTPAGRTVYSNNGCPVGDVDGTGCVDLIDVNQIISMIRVNFDPACTPKMGLTQQDGDVDGNGCVDLQDVNQLISGIRTNFNPSCPVQ